MSTNRMKLLEQITERQFQTQVEQLLDLYGWRWYHAPDNKPVTSKTGKKYVQNIRAGYPDICAVRNLPNRRLIYMELKRERNYKVSDDQKAWMDDLAPHAEVYVFHPSDMEKIRQVLKR